MDFLWVAPMNQLTEKTDPIQGLLTIDQYSKLHANNVAPQENPLLFNSPQFDGGFCVYGVC